MRRRLKLRLLAAATACLMALLPVTAMAVTENDDPNITAELTKTCAPSQNLKPGDTVQYQVKIKVQAKTWGGIDDTVFKDTWSAGLELTGEPEISPQGFKLKPKTSQGTNTMSYDICTFMDGAEGDGYVQGLLAGDEVTITYTMKVTENATGALKNTAELTGLTSDEKDCHETAEATVNVLAETPAASPTPAAEDAKATNTAKTTKAELDESPKTGDTLPCWLLKILEIIGH